MALRPAMRLRIVPRFPARIQGTDGIAVDRTGGVVTVRQDWSNIAEAIDPADLDDMDILVRDNVNDEFVKIQASDFVAPIIATQAEAEAGVSNTKVMTPLRTKQHVDARVGTTAGTIAAGDDARFETVPNGYVTDAKVATPAAPANGVDSAKIKYVAPFSGSIARILLNKASDYVSVADFGAVLDGVSVTGNTSITSGSAALTVVGAAFTAADVGKTIVVPGAAAASADLVTTISAYTSATQITLGANAGTTLSAVSKTVSYGTNNTTAIQAALTVGRNAFVPGSPNMAAFYLITGALNLNKASGKLWGDGYSSRIKTTSASAAMLNITSHSVHVSDVSFDSLVTRTGSDIVLDGVSYTTVEHCELLNSKTGVQITGAASTGIRLKSLDIRQVLASGNGVLISTTANSVDIVLRDLWITGASSVSQPTAAVNLINAGDITLDKVSTVYCGAGLLVAPTAGKRVQAALVSNCYFDSGTGSGINLAPVGASAFVNAIRFTNTWCASNAAHGLSVATSGGSAVQDVRAANCLFSNNGAWGVIVNDSGCVNVSVQNSTMSGNISGGFIAGANVTRFDVLGCTIGPCGEFAGNGTGVALSNGCNNFNVSNNRLTGNTLAASIGTLPGTRDQTYWMDRNEGYATENTGVIGATTDGSGDLTVTHGLAATPGPIFLQINNVGQYIAQPHTQGASTFKLRIVNSTSGAAITGTAFSVAWRARV